MPITIHSDFDAGNIEVLGQDGARAELAIRKDHQSDFFQWFYFRVDGAAGQALELRITNAGKAAYTQGWPGYRACVSDDNAEWVRTETHYEGGVLTIRHTPVGEQVWFAYFAPYSTAQHEALVAKAAAMPGFTNRVLGETLDERPIDLLSVGEGKVPVWIIARQHPGETMAEWWMEGAIEALGSDDPVAAKLRQAATLHIVPNMNPDGSARGHLRTNAVGVNLNREWAEPSLERSPEVFHVRAEMDRTGAAFVMDVHGDEAIPHVFMAGFEGIPTLRPEKVALYGRYLERLSAHTPDFQTKHGYGLTTAGKANMTIATNQHAERFGAVAMTLEMPFKDHDDHPDARAGWSPARSKALGVACLKALADLVDELG